MRSRTSISRRHLLRGGASAAVALPFLEIMGGREARAAGGPKRLFVMHTGGGPVPPGWKALGSETNFQLPQGLTPLAPYKNDMLLVYGVDNKASGATSLSGAGAHQTAAMTALTGSKMLAGGSIRHNNQADKFYDIGGISFDQVVAKQIGEQTRFKSLQLGVQSGEVKGLSTIVDYMSAAGPKQALPNETDPTRFFSRVFGDLKVEPGKPAPDLMRLRAQRQSVLDTIKRDYELLSPRLGAEDRQRLQAHLESLRGIERGLDAAPNVVSAGCMPPAMPVFTDIPTKAQAMFDMAGMALVCDLSRVVTMMATPASSHITYTWLGHTKNHHELGHSQSRPEALKALIEVENWWAGHLARLVAKLKATPEGTGTAFDNTVIVWVHELRDGGTHSTGTMSYLVMGSGGGKLRTGRYLDFEGKGRSQNDLWVSILNAFDLPVQTFGDAALCKGPLPGANV